MVSRWNYIAITGVMFITFVLFQFTNVMLESWNHYEENSYVRDMDTLPDRGDVYEAGTEIVSDSPRRWVVYIGDEAGRAGEVVQTWASYTKRGIQAYGTLEEYEGSGWQEAELPPEMVIINSGNVDWADGEACGYLAEYAEAGVGLVFCGLPDVSVIEGDRKLQALLGVSKVRKQEMTVEGVYLYEGFLLGGEALYHTIDAEENAKWQDMELTFPWYTLSEGTEVYMRGTFVDETMEEEDFPPVIWKNDMDHAAVFAVNGGYMEDVAGLGILSAISSEMKPYEIYPVVNAQNMIIANYPGLAAENRDEMIRRYGRTLDNLFQDAVWPALIAVYRQNGLGLSSMMALQFDYEDDNLPDQEQFQYYMRRLNEERAETGLSGICISDTPLEEKLTADRWFMEGALPDYRFTSFYAGGLDETEVESALREDILQTVRTVVTDYEGEIDVVGYLSEKVTRQPTLVNGMEYTYLRDFRIRSIETALGYGSVLADMKKIAYPQDEEDALTELTSSFGWNTQRYFAGFQGLEGTTVSECDERIRNFLALDYGQSREGQVIHLEINGAAVPGSSSWFLLRCDNERVSRVEGGSWKELEKNVYLIEAQENSVTVTLKAAKGR